MKLYFSVPYMLPCIMLGTEATLLLCRFDFNVCQIVELLQHVMCETIKAKVAYWMQDTAET
jgi:hypothetical protein